MKRITMDYELYRQELKEAFQEGFDKSGLLKEAREIIGNYFSSKLTREDIYKWLKKYHDADIGYAHESVAETGK